MKNSDKNYFNNQINSQKLNQSLSNEDFIGNKINNFYKLTYNIEIISLFTKKNEQKNDKKIKENEQILDFYILIRDSNRLIFKYKLIKSTIKDYKKSNNQELINIIYENVDKKLSNYCTKKYLDKMSKEELLEFREEVNKINSSLERK